MQIIFKNIKNEIVILVGKMLTEETDSGITMASFEANDGDIHDVYIENGQAQIFYDSRLLNCRIENNS